MNKKTSWKAASWEGARREQLRRALRHTVRERLEIMEALETTGDRLLQATQKNRRQNNSDTGRKKPSR